MPVDVKYKTSATAVGGRDGRTRTEDGKIDLQLAVPKELGDLTAKIRTRSSFLRLVTRRVFWVL